MKYKLFVSDYDGTLGHAPQNTIDKEILTAIKEYNDKGGKFAICSGRNIDSLTNILNNAGLDSVEIIVGIQGSIIKDLKQDKIIFNQGLDKSTAIDFANRLISDGNSVVVFLGDVMHYQQYDEKIKTYISMHGNISHKGNYVKSLEEAILSSDKAVSKVLGIADEGLAEHFQTKYNQIYKGNNIIVNSGGDRLIEGINPDFDKGNAVKFLAKHYGIPLNEIITVGDSTNDIGLVKGEWHGVAVGDAKQALKEVAKEISVDYKDKPVLHLLKKYCLND